MVILEGVYYFGSGLGQRGCPLQPVTLTPPCPPFPLPPPQVSSQDPQAITTFEHWPLRAADWLGPFNTDTFSYSEFNETAYAHSVKVGVGMRGICALFIAKELNQGLVGAAMLNTEDGHGDGGSWTKGWVGRD
jgi:hypothetical protein